MYVIVIRWIVIVIWWPILRWTRYALALDDYTITLPQPTDSLRRMVVESFLTAGWFRSLSQAYAFLRKQEARRHVLFNNAQSASHAPASGPI
jgi:hypothetical protein